MTEISPKPAERSPYPAIFLGILAFLALWILSGVVFGPAGVVLPALALVPAVFAFIILISLG